MLPSACPGPHPWAKNTQYYSDAIMSTMASQITSLTIVYSTAYSGADQRKHQSSASLAFVRGVHRWSVNSPHKGSVTQKMFPFDDVIMQSFFQRGLPLCQHIETKTKWTPFCRRHFKFVCLCGTCSVFIQISLKFVFKGPVKTIQYWFQYLPDAELFEAMMAWFNYWYIHVSLWLRGYDKKLQLFDIAYN